MKVKELIHRIMPYRACFGACLFIALFLSMNTVLWASGDVDVLYENLMLRTPNSQRLALSHEEKKWLEHHKTIRVTGPKAFPPFHFFGNDGRAKGIAADYMQVVADLLGINIETEKILSWPEVLEKIQGREIDVIACAAKTVDREKYMIFTDPFLAFPMVIMSRNDSPFVSGLHDLHGLKVACIRRVSTYEWLKRDGVKIVPHFVDTPLDALESVSGGQADFFIGNLASCSHLIDKHGLFNLKVAAPTEYGNYELYMAVRNDWPEMVGILNKTLRAMNPRDHTAIRNKWLSIRYEHGVRTLDILKWVGLIIAFFMPLLIAVFIWNRRLNREIELRKNMEAALRKINVLKEQLISSASLQQGLDLITEAVVDIFNADFARIWIIKNGDICGTGCSHAVVTKGPHVCRYRNRCLHLMSSSGRYPQIDGTHRRVPFGCYKIGQIASGQTSKVVTNGVVTDPRIHDRSWAAELGLVSFAGYRLLSGEGEPIGVIALFSRNGISLEEDALLEDIANTASQIIQVATIEAEREKLIEELQATLSQLQTLSGLLPICSNCKNIRDDKGYWNRIEAYIQDHTDAQFTHGICPDCIGTLYPEFEDN